MTNQKPTNTTAQVARRDESAIYTRLFDLIAWLTPCVEKFPRSHRFTLAIPLLDTGYACHASLIRARKVRDGQRHEALLEADVLLETLRLQWRVALELHCVNIGQFEHGARLMDEIGRMLGAKLRGVGQERDPSPAPGASFPSLSVNREP